VDDELFGSSQKASLSIMEDVLMNPSKRTKKISFERCAGGEARAEVSLTLTLLGDNKLSVAGTLNLFEGASCTTGDREDTSSSTLEVIPGGQRSYALSAKSTGVGGGDSASLELTIRNASAP
jgi:hypothetical protein